VRKKSKKPRENHPRPFSTLIVCKSSLLEVKTEQRRGGREKRRRRGIKKTKKRGRNQDCQAQVPVARKETAPGREQTGAFHRTTGNAISVLVVVARVKRGKSW